jgi:hypothetical protein
MKSFINGNVTWICETWGVPVPSVRWEKYIGE